MRHPSRVFLVGPMGSGKSTIGKQLAAALGLGFQDSDHEIQRRTGVDIPTIFTFEGEAGFRAREKSVIDALTALDGQVLATGGGAILDPDNRRVLSSRGIVIYLHCSPEQQHRRTSHDRNRPLLQTDDPLQRLHDLMAVRDSLYREAADFVVSTEKRSAASVVKEIVRLLEERGRGDP